jgi:hypothetical protein
VIGIRVWKAGVVYSSKQVVRVGINVKVASEPRFEGETTQVPGGKSREAKVTASVKALG